MYTIFEQGRGQGIGHSIGTFKSRFIEICKDHIKEKRAKAFAFIFYDFNDSHVKKLLKDQGVFTKLDRLSGHDLSVFYLHSNNRDDFADFNNIFLEAFEIQDQYKLPFVLFFRFTPAGVVKDIEIVELEQTKLIYAFPELYDVIEKYISGVNKKSERPAQALRVFKYMADKAFDVLIAKYMTGAN